MVAASHQPRLPRRLMTTRMFHDHISTRFLQTLGHLPNAYEGRSRFPNTEGRGLLGANQVISCFPF